MGKGRKPLFDYDSSDFYNAIYRLAVQGLTDAEIADGLDDKLGARLDPDTFNMMKNGKYVGWSKEQNERRSALILGVLARGRRKINAIIRGAYLKAALGGKRTKNKNVVYRYEYDENGVETARIPIQATEAEIELPPNIQALSTWLFHHDADWRRRQRGQDTEASDIPADIPQGVDIDAWIKKEIETNNENNNS